MNSRGVASDTVEHCASRSASHSVKRLAYLSVGSNLGCRMGHLRRAVLAMPDVVGVSRVYETEPVGGPKGQRAYLNAVIALFTDLSARSLLQIAQELEHAAGRVRTVRWGARTLDVDVLLVGAERHNDRDLVVPHPRMWERRFVLEPLYELAPELASVGLGGNVVGSVRVAGRL